MADKRANRVSDETRNQPPEEIRASNLTVRADPEREPGAPAPRLHERILSAIRAAEREGRQAEGAGLNNVLVALHDARYKASTMDATSEAAKQIVKELAAL